jgi:adhesin transport system membrane fusion protein
MAWAELDTVVRAQGKVIPSSQVQKIQSLEGGVVSEILVHEGDSVDINQPLMKISDITFLSSYEENSIRYLELRARIVRLKAEANNTAFGQDADVAEKMPALLESAERLFQSNAEELAQSISILDEQVKQAKSQLLEAEAQEKQLARSLALLKRELKIKKPLVERQVLSEVEYLQLQGREAEAEGNLEGVRLSIPRLRSIIDEAGRKMDHGQMEFQNRARKELNEAKAEASRIGETQRALADRVARTILRSPVNGTVKRILSNTVGGVIRSGMDIIEIVPSEDSLLIEVEIKPADIGNVEVGQTSRIKFTAYDFAIYGSIKGEVRFISADTITNEEGNSYYVARVKPERAYMRSGVRELPFKVGMTAEVDIITGKKTILNYLLKPINRAMDSALREG